MRAEVSRVVPRQNNPPRKISLSTGLNPPSPAPLLVPELPSISPNVASVSIPEAAPLGEEASTDANGESLETRTESGRALFDNGERGFWSRVKDLFSNAQAHAAPSAPPVTSLQARRNEVWINGQPAKLLGFGSFKDVYVHPSNSGYVVKIFKDISSRHTSLDEKRLEAGNMRLLAPLKASPRLTSQGAFNFKGKPTGFIVTDRVIGSDLQVMSAEKLRMVVKLFDDLSRAGLEIGDSDRPLKLRQNIMTGSIGRTPPRAYLIDADLVISRKNPRELRAFYGRILASLSAG